MPVISKGKEVARLVPVRFSEGVSEGEFPLFERKPPVPVYKSMETHPELPFLRELGISRNGTYYLSIDYSRIGGFSPKEMQNAKIQFGLNLSRTRSLVSPGPNKPKLVIHRPYEVSFHDEEIKSPHLFVPTATDSRFRLVAKNQEHAHTALLAAYEAYLSALRG